MPIVAIIVPALQILLVLEVVLKKHENIRTVSKVVNKKTWSISKIDIWSNKSCRTDAVPNSNWTFLFGIDSNSFRIPSMNSIGVLLENLDDSEGILFCTNDSSSWNAQICQSFVHSCITNSLGVIYIIF